MELKIALGILVAVVVLTAVLSGAVIDHYSPLSVWHKVMLVPLAFTAVVFIPLSIALPVALLVGTAILVLRWMGVIGPRAAQGEKSAREILDERFARGEIDKDEYEERGLLLSS